jgi:hypothetical protein
MLLEKDKRAGQEMMKYATNHPENFDSTGFAFLCGFF